MSTDEGPVCCGDPMYRCDAEHTDGKRYWHCHHCLRNREITDGAA